MMKKQSVLISMPLKGENDEEEGDALQALAQAANRAKGKASFEED
jgi:hypothetical protein